MGKLTQIGKDSLLATIDSEGAQLISLSLDGKEYLWQRDETWWPRSAPILFPIVGVLKDGMAQSAQGPVKLSRHGIARTFEHEVAQVDDTHVTYTLCSSEKSREAFPFDFRLNMTYRIEDGALYQTFAVTNTGDVNLPFTLGGHPAFNVPAPGCTDSFDEYWLEFKKPWTFAVPAISEEGIHDFAQRTAVLENESKLLLTHDLFERLLTLTLEDVPENTVRLVGPEGHGVEVDFDGFGYLGVWSAEGRAPFVAVEPWCGVAAATDDTGVFEEKRGIITLAPGQSIEKTFSMRPF